jgi:hypothetical protein
MSGTERFSVTGNSLDGKNTPINGSGTVVTSTLTAANFNGVTALRQTTTVAGNATIGTTNIPLASTDYDYLDSNYNYLGSDGGNEYRIVAGAYNIPTVVRVNDTGTFGTENRYTNSTKSVSLGTSTRTYAIEADTASSAILKLISTNRSASNALEYTAVQSIRIYSNGSYKRLSSVETDYKDKYTMTFTFE